MIKKILSDYGMNYIEQYKNDDCKYINKLEFDFAVIKNDKVFCFIEYDGKQHFEPIKFFGGENEFDKTKIRDSIKNEYCNKNNIPLLRLPYILTYEEIKSKIINIIDP